MTINIKQSGILVPIAFLMDIGKIIIAKVISESGNTEKFAQMMIEADAVDIEDVQPTIFEQILLYAYTKTCDVMKSGPCDVLYKVNKVTKTPLKVVEDFIGDPNEISAFEAHKMKKKQKRKISESTNDEENEPRNAFEAVRKAAVDLKVYGLIRALDFFEISNDGREIHQKKNARISKSIQFNRKFYANFRDVRISCCDDVEIEAHKCILAARLEYFRGMFGFGGWIESEKELKLPLNSAIVNVIIDFLYRDEAPAIVSSEDIEFISNVLIAADQFLIKRLVQICERQLSYLMTLKNVAEILQFAVNFNAVQLQRSAMEFVSRNLAALLESKGLNVLDDDVMIKLTEYYREHVLKNQRHFKAFNSGPSIEDIKALYAESPLKAIQEIIADDAEFERQNSSLSSAKKRSRRNSSGDSGNGIGKTRTTSCSSLSSAASDLASEASLDLDDIVPREETPKDNNSHPQNGVFNKKFQKKSQKERKRVEEEERAKGEAEKSSLNKSFSWGKEEESPSTAFNLADIINSESEKRRHQQQGQTSSTRKPRTKKSSWRQLSFNEDASDIPPQPHITSPWKTPSPTTIKTTSPQSAFFEDIQIKEEREFRNLKRATSKPLAVTQLEEKAIEELKRFYNVDRVFDENITVMRATEGDDAAQMATPVWNRFD